MSSAAAAGVVPRCSDQVVEIPQRGQSAADADSSWMRLLAGRSQTKLKLQWV